jgi:hypothetical protein
MLVTWSAFAATGCATMEPTRPIGDESTPGDAESRRRAVAESTARRDLDCDDAKIVVAIRPSGTDEWQPILEPLSGRPRYVVEGCGQRGLYVESCAFLAEPQVWDEDLPRPPPPARRTYECRYLLVSVVPARSPGAGTAMDTPAAVPASGPSDPRVASPSNALGM